MREKEGNRFVSGPDYMMDSPDVMMDVILPNKLSEFLASHYRRVGSGVVMMEHNTSSVGQFCSFLVNR
ncbi:hypothetical protein TNCV_3291391 [Trichonephila clavipes]|nr:hypothetical protein TNCV_3291391 [Trichonephila clavipes]